MEPIDHAIAPIASKQGRAFTTAHAAAVGISRPRLRRWLHRGAGHRVHRGTYVAGPRLKSVDTDRWCAVLAAGNDAVVGGDAALDDWGLDRRRSDAVEVLVTRRQRPLDGVTVRHTGTMHREDRTTLNGRPTSTVERTLVDVARSRTSLQLCKLISEAAFRRILDLDRLRRTIERNRTRPGIGRLRAALDMYLDGQHGVDSDIESRFARLLRGEGIRDAQHNVVITVFGVELRVDVYVEEVGLVVEVDPEHHDLPDRRREDALRDGLLNAASIPVVRVRAHDLPAGIDLVKSTISALRARTHA